MSKKTLNQTNLEALGVEQLAALLMEVSTGSADIKRRLRLELSHNLGTDDLAHEIRKRLVAIRKSNSFVGWRKRKSLIKDLSIQAAMIVDKIAPNDPTTAFDLLWQFNEIAPSVYSRTDDSKGDIAQVFHTAIQNIESIGTRAILDPKTLAARVWDALQNNDYGEWDDVIGLTAPALGNDGLAILKSHVEAYADAPVQTDKSDHAALQFLRQLRSEDAQGTSRKSQFVKQCLQDIAACAGDTNAYIAQYSPNDLTRKDIAAEVAMLLLDDDRADDAINVLMDADQDTRGQAAWDAAYIACLIATGRMEDAQDHRWTQFCATLHAPYLRDYLKALPDFEDVEAEDRAKAHVLTFPNHSAALNFCIHWPDLVTAANLLETRHHEINGDHYVLLAPAADALRVRHPLAATLLWRAMIDETLNHARSPRYKYAAEHLADCATVDVEMSDYGAFQTHDAYLRGLQEKHARKLAFWEKVRV